MCNYGSFEAYSTHFQNNAMATTSEGQGGAVYNSDSPAEVSIVDSTFDTNTAYQGGALYNRGRIKTTASMFSKNYGTTQGWCAAAGQRRRRGGRRREWTGAERACAGGGASRGASFAGCSSPTV